VAAARHRESLPALTHDLDAEARSSASVMSM